MKVSQLPWEIISISKRKKIQLGQYLSHNFSKKFTDSKLPLNLLWVTSCLTSNPQTILICRSQNNRIEQIHFYVNIRCWKFYDDTKVLKRKLEKENEKKIYSFPSPLSDFNSRVSFILILCVVLFFWHFDWWCEQDTSDWIWLGNLVNFKKGFDCDCWVLFGWRFCGFGIGLLNFIRFLGFSFGISQGGDRLKGFWREKNSSSAWIMF